MSPDTSVRPCCGVMGQAVNNRVVVLEQLELAPGRHLHYAHLKTGLSFPAFINCPWCCRALSWTSGRIDPASRLLATVVELPGFLKVIIRRHPDHCVVHIQCADDETPDLYQALVADAGDFDSLVHRGLAALLAERGEPAYAAWWSLNVPLLSGLVELLERRRSVDGSYELVICPGQASAILDGETYQALGASVAGSCLGLLQRLLA